MLTKHLREKHLLKRMLIVVVAGCCWCIFLPRHFDENHEDFDDLTMKKMKLRKNRQVFCLGPFFM